MSNYQNSEHHTVTVTVTPPEDPDDRPDVHIEFTCTAPEDDPCRTYPECSCETFTVDEDNPGHDENGHPYVTSQRCWVKDWFDACDECAIYVGEDATDQCDHGHPAVARTGHVEVFGGGWDGYIEWQWKEG